MTNPKQYDKKIIKINKGGEKMSRGISKQQAEIMDELKNGAIIQVYRSFNTDLRAFLAQRKIGLPTTMNVRVPTLMALYRKNLIRRKKKVDWDEWSGVWTFCK